MTINLLTIDGNIELLFQELEELMSTGQLTKEIIEEAQSICKSYEELSMPDPTNIYKQALEELEEIIAKQNTNQHDQEVEHIKADRILCAVLRAKGHNELVDAYEQISKWYG